MITLSKNGNTVATAYSLEMVDARAVRTALVCADTRVSALRRVRARVRVAYRNWRVVSLVGPERGPNRRSGRPERRAAWGGGSGADVRALRGGGAGGAGRGRRWASDAAAPPAPVPPRTSGQAGAPRPARPLAPSRQAQSPLPYFRLLRSVPIDSSPSLNLRLNR